MTEPEPASPEQYPLAEFNLSLVQDVVAAKSRWTENPSSSVRRDLMRAILAAIEGYNWQVRQELVLSHKVAPFLDHHEVAALLEETYTVGRTGDVKSQPRFIPLTSSLQLVARLLGRVRPNYKVDFNQKGWSNLQKTIEKRNRIVHPKSAADFCVSDNDVNCAVDSFVWYLKFIDEAHGENNAYIEGLRIKPSVKLY